MSYCAGLSGAENCGPDQEYDPNAVYKSPDGKTTIKGQCVPKGTRGQYGGSWLNTAADVLTAIFPTGGRSPGPGQQQYAAAPQKDNTLLYVGAGAAVLLAAVLISTRK